MIKLWQKYMGIKEKFRGTKVFRCLMMNGRNAVSHVHKWLEKIIPTGKDWILHTEDFTCGSNAISDVQMNVNHVEYLRRRNLEVSSSIGPLRVTSTPESDRTGGIYVGVAIKNMIIKDEYAK